MHFTMGDVLTEYTGNFTAKHLIFFTNTITLEFYLVQDTLNCSYWHKDLDLATTWKFIDMLSWISCSGFAYVTEFHILSEPERC